MYSSMTSRSKMTRRSSARPAVCQHHRTWRETLESRLFAV
jgi:hypothetical protein